MEEWLRSHNLQAGGAVAELEPLIQAAQLLQVGKKTEADAEALVETCNVLSNQQVAPLFFLFLDLCLSVCICVCVCLCVRLSL